MEDRRFVLNDDGAPVEVRANNKLLRLGTSFAVSTAQREIRGDMLHRTELPPSLMGFFFWAGVGGGDDDDTENDELLPPEYPLLPLENYGQYANLLPMPAAPFVAVDPSFSFITRALPATDFIYLLDSRNGLLLFGHLRDDALNTLETCFIVCNPATEQWAAVPSCGRTDKRRLRGPYVMQPYLLFDTAVSSHFHIVLFWQDPVYHDGLETTTAQAYSSEAGAWSSERDWSEEERLSPLEAWRSRHIHDYFTYHIHREAPGAMMNGMLYLIYTRKWILEVDALGKTRATIPAPGVEAHHVLAFFSNSVLFIGESQGRLHCIVQEGREEPVVHLFPRKELMQTSDPDELLDPDAGAVQWTNHGLSIWVLQDRETQEWVLKGRVNFLQLFGRSSSDGDLGYRVVAIHPDRNLVFFFQCWDSKMVSYDIDRQEVRALDTDTDFRHGFAITPYVPYLSELFLGVIGAHK